MSKSKVPVLPTGGGPQATRAYVEQVRIYLRQEFSRGESEAGLLAKLREAGAVYSVRFVVQEEYLLYLGVQPGQLRTLRIIAGVTAMVVFFTLSNAVLWPNQGLRVVAPLFAALAVATALESFLKTQLKLRMAKRRRA